MLMVRGGIEPSTRGFSIRIVRCISAQQATVEDDSDSSCGPPREAVGEAKWPSYNGLPVHCGHWWHDSSGRRLVSDQPYGLVSDQLYAL